MSVAIVNGDVQGRYEQILSEEALQFLATLTETARPPLHAALLAREARRESWANGTRPDFLQETTSIRASEWTVDPIPADLQDRRVEITGPVDRKMVINALNSGANCYMADFEDSNAPTWANTVDGQINLFDAIRRDIDFAHPDTGKHYALNEKIATLLVRPRGLHLVERHITLDGHPLPASVVDFGLYMFHNAKALIERGSGPYFYLPKLESHYEARIWNDLFLVAQRALGLPIGTIKATVLIETLPAAFEMDEILYELRHHSAGLNCGRWDYIFSFIKMMRHDGSRVMPDRSQVGMTQPFMSAYATLAIKTCHRRGAHAMGGMAAQIPIKGDAAANKAALDKVRVDKEREVRAGHDGTWVAHPHLVGLAKEIFDAHMPEPNQINKQLDGFTVTAAQLLEVPSGTRTEAGLRLNIRVGVQYLEAWLRGNGCVPLYNLMEDAATAEISRAQVWQWLKHGVKLSNGNVVNAELIRTIFDEEMAVICAEVGPERFFSGKYQEADTMFFKLCTAGEFTSFLTLPAYDALVAH
jgi:malate synthase